MIRVTIDGITGGLGIDLGKKVNQQLTGIETDKKPQNVFVVITGALCFSTSPSTQIDIASLDRNQSEVFLKHDVSRVNDLINTIHELLIEHARGPGHKTDIICLTRLVTHTGEKIGITRHTIVEPAEEEAAA